MSETVYALRGQPLTIRIEDLTIDGAVWLDVALYPATAEVRATETGEIAATFDVSVDDGDLVLELDGTATDGLDRPSYLWDVRFVDPDTDEPFFWPGADPEETGRRPQRHRLIVTSPVTQPVVVP